MYSEPAGHDFPPHTISDCTNLENSRKIPPDQKSEYYYRRVVRTFLFSKYCFGRAILL